MHSRNSEQCQRRLEDSDSRCPLIHWLVPPLFALCLTACSGAQARSADAGKIDGITLTEGAQKFIEIEAVDVHASLLGDALPGRLTFRPRAMAAADTPVEARLVSIAGQPGQVVKTGELMATFPKC